MSFQSNQNSANQKNIYHIFRDLKREIIFTDNDDYQTFVDFLKEYFLDPNFLNRKKSFTVRGKTYKGVPYQTQNFYGQLELIAYKLEPNRFDLIIKENEHGALEKFIRAISTRYVLFFNKKHNRTGSLFINPYNDEQIQNDHELSQLINSLHTSFSKKHDVEDNVYSSYPEYTGQRVTQWITFPNILLRTSDNQQLKSKETKKTTSSNIAHSKPSLRIPEAIFSVLLLLFLSSLGLNNIQKTMINENGLLSPLPTSKPQVSGAKDETQQPPEVTDTLPKQEENIIQDSKEVVIKADQKEAIINLYESPSINSEVIAQTINGDLYELISIHPNWYKIKLKDDEYAFVQSNFSEIVRKENQ